MYPDGRMQAAEFTKLSADYEGAHYTQRLREKQAAETRFIAKDDGTLFVRGTEKVGRNGGLAGVPPQQGGVRVAFLVLSVLCATR